MITWQNLPGDLKVGGVTATATVVFFMVYNILSPTTVFNAQSYPDMTGVWSGHVRTVQSGGLERDRLAAGGAIIGDLDLELNITFQDSEVFIGTTRTSNMSSDDEGIHVWGSIRSNGNTALFIDSTEGHGQLWFAGESNFEYCYTRLNDTGIMSYCGVLSRG